MGAYGSKQEEFWEACSFGRTWLVEKMLLEDDIDVNWISHIHNCSPIHVASQGKNDVLRLLISHGSNVNAADCSGNTALHHSCIAGQADSCELLLRSGANVNAINSSGWTPLILASYWGHVSLFPQLLMPSTKIFHMNNEGRNALHELCRSKSSNESALVNGVQSLLSAGVAVNARSEIRKLSESEADFTPLLFAAYHGRCLVVEALVLAGADLHVKDMNGWTALHWASQRGHLELVKYLISCDCDVNSQNNRSETCYDVTNFDDVREHLYDFVFAKQTFPIIVSNGDVSTDEEPSEQGDEEECDKAEELFEHVDCNGLGPHVLLPKQIVLSQAHEQSCLLNGTCLDDPFGEPIRIKLPKLLDSPMCSSEEDKSEHFFSTSSAFSFANGHKTSISGNISDASDVFYSPSPSPSVSNLRS